MSDYKVQNVCIVYTRLGVGLTSNGLNTVRFLLI